MKHGLVSLGAWVWIFAAACSDDGVPAATDGATDSASAGSTGVSSITDATVSGTDTASASASASDSASATSPETSASASDSAGETTSATGSASESSGGGSSGSGSSTGEPPMPECQQPGDCELIDDCCSCVAIPVGAEPPPCDLPECFATTCSTVGFTPELACEFGHCTLAPVPCNPFQVACKDEPPPCDPGMVPVVDPGTACWSGGCVWAQYCDVVPECADCPEGEACVEVVTQLGLLHQCSPIAPDCAAGVPTCDCMPGVCPPVFDTCADDGGMITCSCPAC